MLRDRANRAPNMAVIEEVTENGGTLFMDNIKLKVKDQGKRRETSAVSQQKQKAVPHSVDLLLKKQDRLCKDILYSEKTGNKPQFISGANLPKQASGEDQQMLDQKLRELREIN